LISFFPPRPGDKFLLSLPFEFELSADLLPSLPPPLRPHPFSLCGIVAQIGRISGHCALCLQWSFLNLFLARFMVWRLEFFALSQKSVENASPHSLPRFLLRFFATHGCPPPRTYPSTPFLCDFRVVKSVQSYLLPAFRIPTLFRFCSGDLPKTPPSAYCLVDEYEFPPSYNVTLPVQGPLTLKTLSFSTACESWHSSRPYPIHISFVLLSP